MTELDHLRPMNFKVVERGHVVLLIETVGKWVVPRVSFAIAFKSHPRKIINYGGNGLHFAEHVLWNVLASDTLDRSNAITFWTGEMGVYGMCPIDRYEFSIKRFIGGMTMIANGDIPIHQKRYAIEQQRVTCETTDALDYAARRTSEKMFVYNTDMMRAEFPMEYVKRILLEECELGRIVITSNHQLTDGMISLFESLSDTFNTAWDTRKQRLGKPPPIPIYGPPPISLISGVRHPLVYIEFDDTFNIAERVIIYGSFHSDSPGYPFGMEIPPHYKLEIERCNYGEAFDITNPFFLDWIVPAMRGHIDEESINDLCSMKPSEVIEKYGASAKKKWNELVGKGIKAGTITDHGVRVQSAAK